MSNATHYAEKKWTEMQWLTVEHGTEYVRLSVIHTTKGTREVLLKPYEAKAFAEDILRRVTQIEAGE